MCSRAGGREGARALAECVAYRYRARTGDSATCLREARESGAVVAKVEGTCRQIQRRAGALQASNRYRLIGRRQTASYRCEVDGSSRWNYHHGHIGQIRDHTARRQVAGPRPIGRMKPLT